MVHAKNYETVSTFISYAEKNCDLFFPDTVQGHEHKNLQHRAVKMSLAFYAGRNN